MNLLRLNGWPSLTTTDCLSPSEIFPLPKLKKITIGNWPVRPSYRFDLTQWASTKPGAIHSNNPSRSNCLNNSLSYLTPGFWWGRGFELIAGLGVLAGALLKRAGLGLQRPSQ